MEKKKIIKNVKSYICITFILFVAFVALKVFACFVPDELVQPHIEESLNYMMEEGVYPTSFANAEYNLYSQRADNHTDAIFLNVAYNMRKVSKLEAAACDYEGVVEGKDEIERALNMTKQQNYSLESYGRQWFGSVAVLRILLAVFNFQQIKVLSQYVFYILAGIATLLIAKRMDYVIAMTFMALMAIVSPDVVAASINLAGAFYCILIGVILSCLYYQRGLSKYMLLYIVGALTSYFDLFSIPFVTLIVAIFILIIDYKSCNICNFISGFKEMIGLMFSWVAGYVILWMTKWAFASVMGGSNVFADAMQEMHRQSISKNTIDWGPDSTWGYISQSLKLCLENMFPINYLVMASNNIGKVPVIIFVLIIVCVLLIVWIKYHKPLRNMWFSGIMLIMAMFPYVCYAVMHTHAFIHFWMWFRIQIITWLAVAVAYKEAIELPEKRGKK